MKFPISRGLHSISVEFDVSAASDTRRRIQIQNVNRVNTNAACTLWRGELSFKFVFATLFFPVPLKTADPPALLSVGIIVKLYYWCSFLCTPTNSPLPSHWKYVKCRELVMGSNNLTATEINVTIIYRVPKTVWNVYYKRIYQHKNKTL